MARDAAYQEAERRIEEAKITNAPMLDLGGLQLTEVPESLGQLTQLQALDVSNNQLETLPESLGQLTQLQALDVSNNQLGTLPENLGQLAQLQALDASNNQLGTLPENLGQLTQLQRLYLSNNQLRTLPENLGQLTQLQRLHLSNNQLTSPPDWLGQLTQLRLLDLSNNQLGTLPKWLSRLTELQRLYLINNQLGALPEWLGQLTRLQRLYLDDNQLSGLPDTVGQLTQLQAMGLSNNRLSTLPEWLGQLPHLRLLRVDNNPLPSELRAISTSRRLLSFLRELSQPTLFEYPVLGVTTGGRAVAKAVIQGRLFNEAKLLLVGPGEVGKTWLLQALQGKKPESVDSTKGLEINREPLDLPHPTENNRTLHFNCWDFGGQPHYQITHQIFFSPKAIYLLVWKPRKDAEPDLVERLERIQLSVGRTAKVLIVSTHAAVNVPAVLGKDALKERFGDLIEGFYEVDSANGAEGKGIADLKLAIARTAAQLEGMDTPYPTTWHEAQKAVRALNTPTITFREFSEICTQNKMAPDSCESLAIVMDVLGNAVFFGDAPQGDDACVNQDDNLVVLDPEWLAKAVTFILEDQKTRDASGVLVHERLKNIWRRDDKRGCPGYNKKLFGYLLWMMWKFDIAYRQSDQTSLVPEMIHRNRPDDLRWTPTDAQEDERQATLICKIPQDPPAGIIPSLTAAVHPLRRVQNLVATSDRLDRNWRDGFFLDTALRGTAFVELLDRDLHIVVRDKYPRDLCLQIRKTLDRIKADRWPNLNLDYRVPCVGQLEKNKPCPGTFKWDYLNERRGKVVSCQHCNNDEIEVDKMLNGFNSQQEEIMQQLRALKAGQADFMVQALGYFREMLDPARMELERAPNMFSIVPDEVSNWNLWAKATEQRLKVTCWCEHPDGPHPAEEYVLKSSQGWVVKAAPYISWATVLLKAFVPMAGSIAKEGLQEIMPDDLRKQIDLMGDAVKALPTGKLEVGKRDDLEMVEKYRPEIVALRHIHDTLLAQVSESKRWGDLRPVRTKSNQLLWLCGEHAAQQQPPVPQI